MYRLSTELAKEIMSKIRPPEIESSGPNAFLPKTKNSVGIIDPICCIGSSFHFLIESPIPVVYMDLPFIPTGVQGYFLYHREELLSPMEPWLITKALVDPMTKDFEEQIDVSDAAIVLPSNIDKLVAPTISTMEQLVSKYPLILDCLDLSRK